MSSAKFAVQSVLQDCLGVRKNDRVLLLGDDTLKDLSRLFWEELRPISPKSFFLQMPGATVQENEPSNSLAAFMTQFDAILMVTGHSLFHSEARRRACKHGARVLCLAGSTVESLTRTMTGRYQAVLEKSRKIADIFTIGHQAGITSPAGTNLNLSIARMRGFSDTGMALEPGQAANVPGGEGCVSPIPDSVNGVLVVDGSFPVIGPLTKPVAFTIRNGSILRLTGGREAEKLRKWLRIFGRQAKVVAEVGVGTNPCAVLTGNTLEDEKVLGTVHVAFGNSLSFDGKGAAACHLDGIMLKPTLTIDGKVIVENGSINV
jgi:leucyl aminopeptidase (aminopeptidase T)